MKHQRTFSNVFRYKFDNLMSKGPGALIVALGILSFLIVILAAAIIALIGIHPEGQEESMSFIEAAWQSLMRAMDSGTMAGDIGWDFRIITFLVTMGGIFIVSTLIGVLGTGINNKLEQLRKGKSPVMENNHTLILGWSEKIFTIISELTIANENQKKPSIVILANKDKVEMEDEIDLRIPDTKNTKIICRNGNPIDLNDLEIVNPHFARSIVVLSPEEDEPDIQVIKTLLALTKNPGRKEGKYHIVAELSDEKNVEIAETVGEDELTLVLSKDLISRVIAQTCRQSGLSVVYTELLDFDGDEIYFENVPQLAGKTFKDSLFAFEKSTVMGLRKANGEVVINPPMDTVITSNDKVIAIAEDDDKIKYSGLNYKINESIISKSAISKSEEEDILILGWNQTGCLLIKELDSYVAPNSTITVCSDFQQYHAEIDEMGKTLKNAKLIFTEGNTTERKFLESVADGKFEHIILLCYADKFNTKIADAKALITLLHLRNIAEKNNYNFSIVSEILDVKDKELAEVTKADDFVVSNKLISLLLTQLSENKELKHVFDDLFDADGSEIYLKPASDYIVPGSKTDFYTIIESAAQRGHVAIGYRIKSESYNVEKAYGVYVNPLKSNEVTLNAEDKIIVIAED
ncbi:MAG: potassium transporter TrkA [Bacteroidetes bacterium]|nr:potassium transporter TrkA [Bacteroidota bacterium]